MVRRRALAWAALAAAACAVDERTIETRPDPLLVDTFEDGDLYSPDPRFRKWESIAQATGDSTRTYFVTSPGFDSNYCLEDDWQVVDPVDGVNGQAQLLVRIQALASLDLTMFTRFTFARLYRNHPGCAPVSSLRVQFVCYELDSLVLTSVPITGAWTDDPLVMANVGGSRNASRDACLRVVDEIDIWAPADVSADGQCVSGSLLIDDVRFE